MKKLVLLGFLCPTISFAGQCGILHISIQNLSNTYCSLQSLEVISGKHVGGDLPSILPSGATSQPIQVQQSSFSGAIAEAEFRCGDRVAKVFSKQSHCFLKAGDISGEIYTLNRIHGRYSYQKGSYWQSKPGAIRWVIF